MKRTIIRTLIPVLLLSLFISCGHRKEKKNNISGLTNVKTQPVETHNLKEYTVFPGSVEARDDITVSSQEGGTVEDLYFQKGDKISKGEVLAEIDKKLLKAKLDEAKANLKLRKAGFRKSKKLHKTDSITDMEMLKAKTNLEQAKARVETAKVRHNRASVESPVSGIIVEKYLEKGELASPGSPVARIQNISSVKIEIEIPESDITHYEKETPVEISLKAYPGKTFKGKISYISSNADRASRTFNTEVSVENPNLVLKQGMIADLKVLKRKYTGVVAVPLDTVITDEKGDWVFVLKNGKALKKPVSIETVIEDKAIISEGLKAGEELIYKGHRDVISGEKVRKIKEDPR